MELPINLNETKQKILEGLIKDLSPQQMLWLSGFFAGAAQAQGVGAALGSGAAEATGINGPLVSIFYATETGNSRKLAGALKDRLQAAGYRVDLHDVASFKVRRLESVSIALFITSTHGEGDPPAPGKPFMTALDGRHPPKLEQTLFSVLALGDSSYKRYCEAGRRLDARLAELGGQRIHHLQECDVDFKAQAESWMRGVMESLAARVPVTQPSSEIVFVSGTTGEKNVSSYDRSNPFHAEVLQNVLLTDEGSTKHTRHLELLLEGSELTYEPGDSLGIYPSNNAAEVDTLLKELGLSPDESVEIEDGTKKPVRDALISDFEINRLVPPVVKKYAEFCGNGLQATLLTPGEDDALWSYLEGRTLLDLVHDYPPAKPIDAQSWVQMLRRMPPRLYSIASSLKANPCEVHLTVAINRFQGQRGERYGVFSGQCHEAVNIGDRLPVFVQENLGFRLPASPDVPLIMIGPGSGVAPFRAFLQEREEIGAPGPTWLFFGERNFFTDFLYQAEWLQRLSTGSLTRLDVAFSRDQKHKIYVQDRIRERARDLYDWLQQGAHVYVCGDEKRMAPDVHTALVEVVREQGDMTAEGAESYWQSLQEENRYQRDVY